MHVARLDGTQERQNHNALLYFHFQKIKSAENPQTGIF
jgi:hypothetical protein